MLVLHLYSTSSETCPLGVPVRQLYPSVNCNCPPSPFSTCPPSLWILLLYPSCRLSTSFVSRFVRSFAPPVLPPRLSSLLACPPSSPVLPPRLSSLLACSSASPVLSLHRASSYIVPPSPPVLRPDSSSIRVYIILHVFAVPQIRLPGHVFHLPMKWVDCVTVGDRLGL
nr:hypothetical protein CFP56_28747 [Quercus suber]